MKNQSRYIPESISGLSNNSLHLQGLHNQSLTELHSESTDHLVSEILKARAERLLKQQQEYQSEREQNISLEEIYNKTATAKQSSEPQALHNGSNSYHQTDVNVSGPLVLNEQADDSEAAEIQRSKKLQMSAKMERQQESVKDNSSYLDIKHSEREQPENIEPLVNQTKQEIIQLQGEQAPHQIYELQNQFIAIQKQESQFVLQKQKSQSQSIELSLSNQEKSSKDPPQNDLLQSPLEQNQDALQYQGKSRLKKEQTESEAPFTSRKEEQSEHNQSNRTPEGMEAVESQIAARPDASLPDIFVTDNRKNETDQEVVQALTDRLNQINEIEQAENMETLSKRRQSQRNPSFGNFSKAQEKPPVPQQIIKPGSEFETQYSDDIRDHRILEHHYQSNIQCLQDQLNEMIELHEALIMEEECIELRKRVKASEMENRRYRIMLRNASYSKKFNFHSPIPKNNNCPLQFYKKFKVGPLYANQYYETVNKIAEEKKLQQQLKKQYDIFNRFYQLMKNKQISSYPELPFELQYDSKLQKYSIKGGLLASMPPKSPRSTRYELQKSKRSLDIGDNSVNYYDLLHYKKDISRDAILEFQVYQLGRVKKLKDQNKLIQKQIAFVQQQIEEIDRQMKAEGQFKIGGVTMLMSQCNIKSKTSFSRSPKTKTFYRLNNYVSPMERVARMNQSQSKERITLSKNKSVPKLKLSTSKSPRELVRVKSPRKNLKGREKLAQIQDEYGLSTLRPEGREQNEIPTFGRQQSEKMIVKLKDDKDRNKSRSPAHKNYIKINKQLSTRTETNIDGKRQRAILKRLEEDKISPIKKHTFTEPSISVDQSNGNQPNLI